MSLNRRPWPGRIAGIVGALAALTVVTAVGDGSTGAEAEPAGVAAPVSVPTPPDQSSVVTVKTGGDRTGTDTVTPLAGVSLALFAASGDADPIDEPWATCTSDADGDCNFTVPQTQPGGANRNREL